LAAYHNGVGVGVRKVDSKLVLATGAPHENRARFHLVFRQPVDVQPGIAVATGAFVYGIGGLNSVTGINLAEFNRMSGGFHYLRGGPFTGPDDIVLDEIFASEDHKHAGDSIDLMNRTWRVAGVVEPGMLFARVHRFGAPAGSHGQ
jgi:hypothetical protein